MPINPNLPLSERFSRSYEVVGDCWRWTGGSKSHGYGYITHNGKRRRAHRVSFFLRHGYYPPQVNHTCDNPDCVNPDHLYEGTQLENMRDRMERKGWKSAKKCRFTPEQIDEFRQSGLNTYELARKYGVSQSYMSRLLRGKRGGNGHSNT
jgi:hypothetical protein